MRPQSPVAAEFATLERDTKCGVGYYGPAETGADAPIPALPRAFWLGFSLVAVVLALLGARAWTSAGASGDEIAPTAVPVASERAIP